jgi:hypothetical protein
VGVTVVNDGAVAVTLATLKFVVRNDAKRRGIFPTQWGQTQPHSLPVKLTPGDQWRGFTENQALTATLREHFGNRSEYALWVIALDAADREYRSKFSVAG